MTSILISPRNLAGSFALKKKMKRVSIFCLCIFFLGVLKAQKSESSGHRNFPVIISLQFHSISMPFKNFGSNFSNLGIGIGTEVSYNGRQNWVQQFMISWHRNAPVGNSLLLYTQTVWRPTIIDDFYTELKAGIGYNYSFRPVESYKQENGKWISVGHRGKGMLAIPLGIGTGYNKYSNETYVSAYADYHLVILKDYNKSIPLVPETIFETGTRIHFKNN